MPFMNLRGVAIHYEIVGEAGPFVALVPGGRRPLTDLRALAGLIARAGYRVVLHDRRNCGRSDISIAGDGAEYEIHADDLHALLHELGALPAIVGGTSSGCRVAIVTALRHPQAVRALLLWCVTGGAFSCNRLAHRYYGQFIEAAQAGGMAAVAATEHFQETLAARPDNRDRLMALDVAPFIAKLSRWRTYFQDSVNLPLIGLSEQDLRSIAVPACIVPGNDRSHPRGVGVRASELIPVNELRHVMTEELDVDVAPREYWELRNEELAAVFLGFLKRQGLVAPAMAQHQN